MRTIQAEASRKRRGMTLAEVAAWVQDAMNAGISPDEPVKIATGWRQQLERIAVSSEESDEPVVTPRHALR